MSAQAKSGRLRGLASPPVLIAVAVVLATPMIAYSLWPAQSWGSADGDPIMHKIDRSRFINETTERGSVESASNVEIRCEVQSKNLQGTTILWIIPEGTYVEKDTVLCELDKSQLENDRIKQQIICSNSEAALIKAKNDFSTAQIAKREYEEGTFRELEQQIESEQEAAKESLRRSQDYLEYSERLNKRGYVTAVQLEADRFAVRKAQLDLEVADTKLRVLRDFTKAKMLNQLNSAIATAEAAMKAAERSHQLDVEQLQLIESQVEKCTIKAPEPGQVVYASETSSRGSKEIIIQEGEMVRERQVIIRLPDPKRMQVKAKINEARVSMVAPGQQATIRMDAFPDMQLTGTVEKVNEYPAPASWYNPNVKEYETIVKIHESPPGLRPGLTAEVKILIEQIDDAMHVPVQAVFEYGGRHYCTMRSDDGRGFRSQQVELGSTNDKTVIIRSGLEKDQEIVHNAAAYREKVDLPKLTDEQLAASRAARRRPGGGPPRDGPRGERPAAVPNESLAPAATAEQPVSTDGLRPGPPAGAAEHPGRPLSGEGRPPGGPPGSGRPEGLRRPGANP